MNKRTIVGALVAGILFIGVLIGTSHQSKPVQMQAPQTYSAPSEIEKPREEVLRTCDGTSVTSSCPVGDIEYSTYIFHPAEPEISHEKTITTYKEEVVSYCTLCNDGTYSPSCATGRGACSHHGGVAEWNAPRYGSVPEYSTKKVIDTPSKEAYYEKIIE